MKMKRFNVNREIRKIINRIVLVNADAVLPSPATWGWTGRRISTLVEPPLGDEGCVDTIGAPVRFTYLTISPPPAQPDACAMRPCPSRQMVGDYPRLAPRVKTSAGDGGWGGPSPAGPP